MWDLISSFVSLIIGAAYPTLPGGLPYTAPYINQGTVASCYQPDTSNTITLDKNNFLSVSNPRPTLNPAIWKNDSVPSTFNSFPSCGGKIIGLNTSRTYIQVRKEVRISSCKVDELAGPYGKGTCGGWNSNAAAMTHRGSCDVNDYPDLRKIADVNRNGQDLEIFWNPFSHNVGCNYNTGGGINCGPGSRNLLDLKDFIYVLKKRDAFDPVTHKGCLALWDAGSTNENACSHYFDVYLASDVYEAMQTVDASQTTPNTEMYFLKNIVENCQENTTFIPAPDDANIDVPPAFISSPFVEESNLSGSNEGKIKPDTASSLQMGNYGAYVWNNSDIFFTDSTHSINLIKQTESDENITVCSRANASALATGATISPIPSVSPTSVPHPTLVPLPNCYDQIGSISFKDSDNTFQKFDVFSYTATPQTFLLKQDTNSKIYRYSITDKDYPSYTKRNSSLQLGNLEFLTQNQWTWATPWCKPAIYLYPQKPIDISVKLHLDGQMTVSNPQYNNLTGWNVRANPDGTIQQLNNLTMKQFPYLYYEADLNNVNIPKNGFVIPQMNLGNELSSILTTLGFNTTERNDFLKYWLPRLTDRPYYFVTLLPENVINEKETLNLSFWQDEVASRIGVNSNTDPGQARMTTPITPDSMIRSRFVFEGLDTPIKVDPLVVPSHERIGFTLTDWGGTIVGKSCTDITVK